MHAVAQNGLETGEEALTSKLLTVLGREARVRETGGKRKVGIGVVGEGRVAVEDKVPAGQEFWRG